MPCPPNNTRVQAIEVRWQPTDDVPVTTATYDLLARLLLGEARADTPMRPTETLDIDLSEPAA